MHALDADDGPLTNTAGVQAKRDIVQFVKYNDFSDDITKLSENVLKEVPNQLVSYMQTQNIQINKHSFIPVDDAYKDYA
jgi:hypothetical protein